MSSRVTLPYSLNTVTRRESCASKCQGTPRQRNSNNALTDSCPKLIYEVEEVDNNPMNSEPLSKGGRRGRMVGEKKRATEGDGDAAFEIKISEGR